MYKFAIIFMFFFSGAFSASVDLTNIWSSFKSLYSKSYSTDEDHLRFTAFENNTRRIVHHNLEADFGLHTYMVEVNSFAAYTKDEFNHRPSIKMTEYLDQLNSTAFFDDVRAKPPLPTFIDYRTVGVVTAVKNQGDCEDSYIFAAVGALESAWARSKAVAHTKLVALSEQNILDCYVQKCQEKYSPTGIYRYIMKNGIEKEASYPYKGKVTKCKFNKKNIGATMEGFKVISDAYRRTMEAVARHGPVVAGVHTTPDFKSYKRGIFKNENCTGEMDHTLVIAGYGEERGQRYWILKNSWGTRWGEKGYMRLARGHNMCRILYSIVLPLVREM